MHIDMYIDMYTDIYGYRNRYIHVQAGRVHSTWTRHVTIWIIRVAYVDESRRTREWLSRIWIRHVSYMNESWHTCESIWQHKSPLPPNPFQWVRHDAFIRVTWFVHMWVMIRLYFVTWLVHAWDMTHSYMRLDSFMCGTWFLRISTMPYLYV